MALSRAKIREILSEAGAAEDKIEAAVTKIAAGNSASIDAVKEDLEKYKAEAEKLPEMQKRLEELNAKLKDEYVAKSELEKVQKAYDDYKADITAKETLTAKGNAVKAYLESKGIKGDNLRLAMMCVKNDVGNVELDGEKIKDTKALDDLIGGDLSRLVETQIETGISVPQPQVGTGGGTKPKSRAAELAAKYQAEQYGAPANNAKEE